MFKLSAKLYILSQLSKSFLFFLYTIGVQRVEKLKIPGNIKRNILLVDTHSTDDIIYKESQKEIEPGYYLLTYNNTEQKAIYLERISEELHANLKIEIISYQS